jgi:hypothetical protein
MRLLKSVPFGIVTAVLASVAWIVVSFVLPLWVPYLLSRFSNEGVGGASASVSSGSLAVAALIGFVAGFFYRFRRPLRQS